MRTSIIGAWPFAQGSQATRKARSFFEIDIRMLRVIDSDVSKMRGWEESDGAGKASSRFCEIKSKKYPPNLEFSNSSVSLAIKGIVGAELVGDDRFGCEALLSDSLRISAFPCNAQATNAAVAPTVNPTFFATVDCAHR
jgi:hypothetical protein